MKKNFYSLICVSLLLIGLMGCKDSDPKIGKIDVLSCADFQLSGTVLAGVSVSGASITVPYSGGNGGLYDGQAVNSSGVIGLMATIAAGSFANGAGSISYQLSGTPAGPGNAIFTIALGGLSCSVSIPIGDLDKLLKVTMTNGNVIYAHPTDNSSGVVWGGYGTHITALTHITTAAAANVDFNGEANTAAIVAQLGTNNGTPYAAKLCAELVAYGFDDWYLPAAGELNEMNKILGPNGSNQITPGYYWSSSELDNNYAWYQYFDNGFQYYYFYKYSDYHCRCVRR